MGEVLGKLIDVPIDQENRRQDRNENQKDRDRSLQVASLDNAMKELLAGRSFEWADKNRDAMFQQSIASKQFSHDMWANDLAKLGLAPELASVGGIRMPGGTNQVLGTGTNYRTSLPGNPRDTAFTGGSFQQANGWGNALSQV